MAVFQETGALMEGAWTTSTDTHRGARVRRASCMRKHPKQSRSCMMVTSIKHTVLEVICRKGDGGPLRVAQVADVGGVSMGSIYQYFHSLEGIILSIYEDVVLDSFRARGTGNVRPQDCEQLALRLQTLDTLLQRDYAETRYGRYIAPVTCACDALNEFMHDFDACHTYDANVMPYWLAYIETPSVTATAA